MQCGPIPDQPAGPSRQLSDKDVAMEIEACPVLRIAGVEVGRIAVTCVNEDHDAMEPAGPGHGKERGHTLFLRERPSRRAATSSQLSGRCWRDVRPNWSDGAGGCRKLWHDPKSEIRATLSARGFPAGSNDAIEIMVPFSPSPHRHRAS